MKLQIGWKFEYKSDSTESATGMLRMVWFPSTDLHYKEYIESKQKCTFKPSQIYSWSDPVLLQGVVLGEMGEVDDSPDC